MTVEVGLINGCVEVGVLAVELKVDLTAIGILFDLKQLKESCMHNGDFSLHMYDLNKLYTFFKTMLTMKTAIGIVISIRTFEQLIVCRN